MSVDVTRYLEFVKFLHAYRRVERNTCRQGEERHENDVEHSFQVAMTAWYLAEALELDLDLGKVLRYALAHDLVETYAGDVPAFSRDAEAKARKTERERLAAERIRAEFPDFAALHETIAAYEKREDAESRFVYATDKMDPLVNDLLDGGRVVKECSLSLEDIVAYNRPRVSECAELMPAYDEIMRIYETKAKEIFGD